MRLLLLAASGGAIGAGVRHLLNVAGARLLPPTFPWSTLVINVTGSIIMGALIAALSRRHAPAIELRTFLATGILGGFTTFSAFSLEAVQLYERGAATLALVYVLASVILSIAGLAAGAALIRTGPL